MARLTKDMVRKAIEDKGGLLIDVAKACGVSRQAIYKFLEKYPDLKPDLEKAREVTKDNAESKLFALFDSRDERVALGAIKFYLSYQARDRGYNKEEKEEKSNQPIVIEMHGIPRPSDD